jgi:TP901 family phage tail tape measure protein
MGSAMASAGAGAVIAGAAIEAGLFSAGKAAVEYNRQAALTATQTDGVSNALEKVAKIGKRVGKDIGVPFEELQTTLYDVFSSMDVSVPEAGKLLRAFSKAAVAGQTDLQTASRATIAIMNAYDVPVSKVNDVLDFQFRLVQKGVGTYQEFARSIGRSIPSAVRAGQSYHTLGGMLAFMTRNGLSAAMANASAARAMDAISNPKTVKSLHDIGVNALRANGEFRPMVGIVRDLQRALEDMTGPQRAKALHDLFLGAGGTIQARRFFDSVLKDRHAVKELAGFTRDMADSSGILETKYKSMADTLAVKAQLLNNRWQIIKISVGEQLMPVLEKLVGALGKMITWWNKLDENTKKNIVTWTAISGIALIVFGAITALAGAIVMITGALNLMGISAGIVLSRFVLITAALSLLVYGFKTGNEAAILLGSALTGLMIARTLGPMFASIGRSMGEAKAGMQVFAHSAEYGTTKMGMLKGSMTSGLSSAVNGMKSALGRGVAFLGGPWGIAIIAATVLIGSYMAKQRAAAARVQEHTDALNTQTGALTANNRQIAVKALQDSGALAAARSLGIGLKDVTDAALGNAAAQKRVSTAMQEQTSFIKAGTRSYGAHATMLGGLSGEQQKVVHNVNKLTGAIGGSNKEIDAARSKWIDMKEAMGAASAGAEQAGREVGAGLARGIRQSTGLAVGAAKTLALQVAHQARATLESNSPSKVFERIGIDIGKGLINGLLGIAPEVGEVTARVMQGIDDTFARLVDKLGDKHKKIKKALEDMVSEVKKQMKVFTQKIDAANAQLDMAKGIRDGLLEAQKAFSSVDLVEGLIGPTGTLTETQRQVQKSVSSVIDDITRIFNGQRPKLRAQLVGMIQDAQRTLMQLAGQYDAYKGVLDDLNTSLTAANAELDRLINERNQLMTQFTQNFQQGAALGDVVASINEDQALTADAIVTGMQTKVDQAIAFAQQISTLNDLGLNENTIAQIAGLGADKGATVAAAILAGGGGVVAQLNSLDASLQSQTAAIASKLAGQMYDAGIASQQALIAGIASQIDAVNAQIAQVVAGMQAAAATIADTYAVGVGAMQGIINGLNDNIERLEHTMRRIARRWINAIRDVLDSHSPSRVFAAIGKDTIQGAIVGVRKTAPALYREMDTIANNMMFSPDAPSWSNTSPVGVGSPGPGGSSITQEITIHTQEIDPRKHAADLGWELARRV